MDIAALISLALLIVIWASFFYLRKNKHTRFFMLKHEISMLAFFLIITIPFYIFIVAKLMIWLGYMRF